MIRKEDGIAEPTVKKWIAGTRKCKVSAYFPDEEYVKKQELYHLFRRRPKDKLEKLQQILYEKKRIAVQLIAQLKIWTDFVGSL